MLHQPCASDDDGTVIQSEGAHLVLDGLVVSFLQPGAKYDGVVSVTERS